MKLLEAPMGKALGNVRFFYTIEKLDTQSLKALCSSLGYGILSADYVESLSIFTLYLLFILNINTFLKEKGQ